MLAVERAEGEIMPRHVLEEYRPNDLRDAFMDRKGRVWYAETPAMRSSLPANPLDHEKIPSRFWHPSTRRKADEERKWARDIDSYNRRDVA